MADLADVAEVRDRARAGVPLLVIRVAIPRRDQIAADMARGARDSAHAGAALARAHAVIARELKAYRIERALRDTLQSAQDYRPQLETVLTRSHDAIAAGAGRHPGRSEPVLARPDRRARRDGPSSASRSWTSSTTAIMWR